MINKTPTYTQRTDWTFLFISLKTILLLLLLSSSVTAFTAGIPLFLKNDDISIVKNWQIISGDETISDQINLPILAPANWNKVTFRNTFLIPDTIQNKNIQLWVGKIHGNADLKINNISIRRRLNYPTGFKIPIPQNLLNSNGENTLEITINKPQSTEEGVPELVRLFSHQKNLGICGNVIITWDKNVNFREFTHNYAEKSLTYRYQLSVKDPQNISKAPYPKLRCEEELLSPSGKIIHKRFQV
jgi:hypothetical protein